MSADLSRQASGDLAHRSQQRQSAAVGLDGLIGDGGGAGLHERRGERLIRGEVEVGEQDEIRAQEAVLLGDRLLDLEHEVAGGPRGGGVRGDLRSGSLVFGIGDERALTGSCLHGDLMAVGDEFMDAGSGDGDSELIVLDLGGH